MAKKKLNIKRFFHDLRYEQSTDEKMSLKEIWSYGLCDFGKSGSQTLINSTAYIQLFLLSDLHVDLVSFGVLLTVMQVIGYVQGPFISLLEDSTKSKWGRFRPYFILSAPIAAALAILFFLNPFEGNPTGASVWMYIVYILFGIVNGFCNTAWSGLTKCITQNTKERERAFSISKGLGIVSTTLPSWLPVMVQYGPQFGISVRLVFVILSLILGILGFVAVATAKNMRERVMIERVEKPWKTAGMVFKNKNKIITWLGNLGSPLTYLVNMATPYVLMYCYEAYGLQTFVWGAAGIFAWASLIFSKYIYKHFSSKAIIIIYNLMTIVANVILFIVGYGTGIGYIIALFATRCFAAVLEYVASVATTTFDTDIWDHYEWKYHMRNESTTDLVGSWVVAPISILNPLIYTWVFQKIQFNTAEDVQTEFTKDWLFIIYTLGSSVACLLTILPYFFIKLDKKTMEIVHKDLAERKASLQASEERSVDEIASVVEEFAPVAEEIAPVAEESIADETIPIADEERAETGCTDTVISDE